ncbi:TPA: hypothetical protein JBF13_05400 [Legionella pneumophila]|nr:hypothetical protein [Legionella pneumophila]
MSKEFLLELTRLLGAGIAGAVITQILNHFLVIRRSKKERRHQYSEKKLHSLYAPLLIQSELLEREIKASKAITEPDNQQNIDDSDNILKSKVLGHHSNNMIGIQGNIIQLISDNYGLINDNDKDYMMSFIKGIQEVSLMQIDNANFAIVDSEKSEGKHPFEILLKTIDLLRTNLEPSIERLKLEVYP